MDATTVDVFDRTGIDDLLLRNTNTETVGKPWESSTITATLSMGTASSLHPTDQTGTLPIPESPLLSNSPPQFARHRHTASLSSGPHPPSPLAQAPLVPPSNPDTYTKRSP